jgi:7-cyano-7-deazaguanine synthase
MGTALLLSGGIDSVALAYWHRPELAITVDYGQLPAAGEVAAAKAVCAELAVDHVVVHVDCSSIGSGDLLGTPASSLAPVPEWWPFRNQLLVTLAASAVAGRPISRLLLGTVLSDRAHADGTPEFVAAMSSVLGLQEGGLCLDAPAITLTSAELVRRSGVPRDLLAWAHSCHVANFACGFCRGCSKHLSVLRELGFRA